MNTNHLPSFVAIDFETANESRSSICEIGITEVINGKVQPSKSWLVKPEDNYYDPFNIYIHGITPSMTENSPEFPEVWKEVLPYLNNKIVVAHNTAFDMYALRDVLDMYNIEYPEFDYFCTLRVSRYIIKDSCNYSLSTLLSHLNINAFANHRAGDDSYGCAMLMLECLKRSSLSIDELESTYEFERGKFQLETFIPQHSLKHSNYSEFIKNMVVDESQISEDNYFFKKNVCFTGTCASGERKVLLQKIANVGGIPTNNVSRKTDVLVVGQQDYRIVGEDGMSTKQEKAYKLRNEGVNIEIISEKDFLTLIA